MDDYINATYRAKIGFSAVDGIKHEELARPSARPQSI